MSMKRFLVLMFFCGCVSLFSVAQPNFNQIGFSTQNGGTTGGQGGQTVTATSYSQLKSYAESSTAYVIMVEGTITNGAGGGQIRIKSNKSIIGVGSTAFLSGVGLDISSQSNIIIQNLKITLVGTSSPKDINGGDCIGISGSSKNIWVDHCELYSENPNTQTNIDKYDGLLDIKGQSGFITISWCYWHDHHKGGLVGAADDDLYADRLVTIHHNYFNNVKLRLPMYRGATGHFFNNYIKDADKASEIRAGTCVRVEKNYYDNYNQFAIYTTSDSPGKTERIDNYLSKTQSRAYPANCTANIPYSYSAVLTTNTQDVKTIVPQYAGVGKIGVIKDCNGTVNGTAYLDECNTCVGGTTGKTACVKDCNGVVNGTATLDDCGVCTGGNTGKTVCTSSLEAEKYCSATATIDSDNAGFKGTGFVNFDNNVGSSGTWNIVSQTAKTATIGIRYANGGTSARSMSITVNGVAQGTFTASPTGSWTTWLTESKSLNLRAGVNTIVLTATTADGGPNLDLFAFNDATIVAGGCTADCNGVLGGTAYKDSCNTCVGGNTGKVACSQDCQGIWGGTTPQDNCGVCLVNTSIKPCSGSIEAEEACVLDGTVDNNNAGFSGDGFANTTNALGSKVSWILNSDITQTATISFRYANGGAASRGGTITINGNAAGELILNPTGSWTIWKFASINLDLEKGANEITITATTGDGLANLDLVTFSSGISDSQCGLVTQLEEHEKTSFFIYPNPTQNQVQWNELTDWTLYNAMGVEWTRGKGTQADLSDFENGIYLLNINGNFFKVVKE